MKILTKTESKLLGRTYIEIEMEGKAGMISRKDAVSAAATELNVPGDQVALLRLDQKAGSREVVGRFFVYSSPEGKKKVHPPHLAERILTKEEREKLRQDRKKAATPPPAPEKKK